MFAKLFIVIIIGGLVLSIMFGMKLFYEYKIRRETKRLLTIARERTKEGRWSEASSALKNAIERNIGEKAELISIVRELESVYAQQGLVFDSAGVFHLSDKYTQPSKANEIDGLVERLNSTTAELKAFLDQFP
jgi:hypothetical protein